MAKGVECEYTNFNRMFDLRLRAPMIGSVQGVSDSLEVFYYMFIVLL